VNLDLRNCLAFPCKTFRRKIVSDRCLTDPFFLSFFFSLSCLDCGLSNRAIRKMEMAITRKELGWAGSNAKEKNPTAIWASGNLPSTNIFHSWLSDISTNKTITRDSPQNYDRIPEIENDHSFWQIKWLTGMLRDLPSEINRWAWRDSERYLMFTFSLIIIHISLILRYVLCWLTEY
jgi:hypothetical protein